MKKFAVIGHPVAHSLSPLIHQANFSSLGYDASYEKIDVESSMLGDFIKKAKDLGYAGLNVTVPHKVAVLDFVDIKDDNVLRYGSINTIRFESCGKVSGFNTDVKGFLDALSEKNFDIKGKKVLVFGCGGAGQALALCAAYEGARTIYLAAKHERRALALETEMKRCGFDARAMNSPIEDTLKSRMSVWCEKSLECDLVINATPVGLNTADAPLLTSQAFRPRQFVLDIIPTKEFPPTAKEALAAGADVYDGIDFLVSQAAESFKIWTGENADKRAMLSAVRWG